MKKIDGLEIVEYKNRIANISVGASSLRNQGRKGLVEKTRKCLKKINLSKFNKYNFKKLLKIETKKMMKNAELKFGSARKSLNLFLLQCSLDRCLSYYYKLNKILDQMELPLDSYTIKHLKNEAKNKHKLPKWDGIIHLKEENNVIFQEFAKVLAEDKKIPRVYLDLIYWRKEIHELK